MTSGEFDFLTPDDNPENSGDAEELSAEEFVRLGEVLGFVGLTSHEMNEDLPEMNAIVILTPGVEFLAGLLTDKNYVLDDLRAMSERDAQLALADSDSTLISRRQAP